jgi:hypothetical protein
VTQGLIDGYKVEALAASLSLRGSVLAFRRSAERVTVWPAEYVGVVPGPHFTVNT